ncbi:MAG TPA: TraB/GumN family protein [Burkholderiales bacterium]|nr:TraB/GumN family protein [Burkholderiales bacterium]
MSIPGPVAFAALARLPRAVAVLGLFAALSAVALQSPAAERYEYGLLWRVEGGGAPASHVFGTVHLADPRVTRLPPAVAQELDQARSITLETGIDSTSILGLAGRMVFTDGRDLAGVAGTELFGRAAKLTEGLGLPEPVLRQFRPWAVTMLLSVPPQDPTNVLDFVLERRAADQGKPIHQLESLDEQISVLEGMSEEDQVALLKQAVDEYESMPRRLARVVDAYLARDLAGLWRVSQEGVGSGEGERRLNEVFTRRLLHERNARMAERAEPRLREGGAFIAVGALHLYGGSGVLAQLEQRGWRVTRVY